MNTRIFEAFEAREHQVTQFMAGCGMKYGMDCTCGPSCRCKDCPIHSNGGQQDRMRQQTMQDPSSNSNGMQAQPFGHLLQVDQPMEFFGMEPPSGMQQGMISLPPAPAPPQLSASGPPLQAMHQQHEISINNPRRNSQRNPSVISYGNGLRGMSLTSETTFGRAMSGLSALSIDWENLEDFDVEVDHSAHINNSPGGARRSSLRRSVNMGNGDQEHVSFKV